MNNLLYIICISLIYLTLNKHSSDNLAIMKSIIIYLLILIIWKSSNTTKEHYGTWVIDSNGIKHIDYYKWDSESKWIWIKSLHTNKKVLLPENHILMKILHQNLEYTKFMKAIQAGAIKNLINSIANKTITNNKYYDELLDCISRKIYFEFKSKSKLLWGYKHTYTDSNDINIMFNEYVKAIEYWERTYGNRLPGMKCYPFLKTHCAGKSLCKSINSPNDHICTVGKDGKNPVDPSTQNGNKHYLPVKIYGCHHNRSNLKCPPKHACLPSGVCKKIIEQHKDLIIDKDLSSNRLNFVPPLPILNINECPKDHTLLIDDYKQYCKNDNDPKDICRLDVDGDKEKPICSSVQCPDDYEFRDQLCVNKFDETKVCSFDYDNKEGYSLCGDFNSYIPFENTDIKDNNLNAFSNVDAKTCANECNQNLLCTSFTIDQNSENTKCYLKKSIASHKDIKENEYKISYFRNPLNYNTYMNTTVNVPSIKSFNVKTPYECSKYCDEDDKCNAFVIDKKTLKCDLKPNFGKKTSVDKNKIVFNKKFFEGSLCDKFTQDKLRETIKSDVQKETIKYKQKIKRLKKEHEQKLKDTELNSAKLISKKTLNIFGNSRDTIIWDNINSHVKEISIRNTNLENMGISYIQIIGSDHGNQISNLLLHNTTIETDDNTNLDNLLNEQQNTHINPTFINLKFNKIYLIHRIIIYIYNKIIIYPLEIKLLNNDGFIEKKWSQANINDDPKIFEYKIEFKSKVSDKGNPELFHTYTDILGDNKETDYCRFVNNDKEFCCKINNSKKEYDACVNSDIIKTNYPNTYFFNKNNKTNRDDLCWCEGIPPNNQIKCIKNNKNNFDNPYILATNIDCNNRTGKEIKEIVNNTKNDIDLTVHCGFYWDKTASFYLFRNTTLNGKAIVLFTLIDADTYKIKRGYPKIVNNDTFPGLTMNKRIKTILYAGNNIIYLINHNIFIKYDLVKKKQFAGYPKKLLGNWKFLDINFQNNIDNSIYINKNVALLFNKSKYIKYNLELIENNKNSPTDNYIKYSLQDEYPNIKSLNYSCIMYNYSNDIYLFFNNNTYTIYNHKSKKVTNVHIDKQWKNIWKFI